MPLVSQSHGIENLVSHVMDQTDIIQLDIMRQDLPKHCNWLIWMSVILCILPIHSIQSLPTLLMWHTSIQ